MKSAAQLQMSDDPGLVVQSEVMRRLVSMVERVSKHDASVLIVGETGSGKEMVARAIHRHSPRNGKAFIDVNCAALPEHLLESELFGYEKGAFSGADGVKPGLFELAEDGTLLLDEIGELDLKFQAKLLRVLDRVPYYRLGGSRKIAVNARVIAATNRDLEDEVRAGRFRMDLYHRLVQFKIQVPPLRERPEDILGLANHFLQQHCPGCTFGRDAEEALQHYAWPGNVRELKNVVFQAAIEGKGGSREIGAHDLPHTIWKVHESPTGGGFRGSLEDMEQQTILRVLAETGGNQAETAQQLGISDRTLRRKLAKYKKEQAETTAANALGALTRQQQRYFRVTVELPVTLVVDGTEVEASSVNISTGGLAIRTATLLNRSRTLSVSFILPGMSTPIKAEAILAWTEPGGTAGLNFVRLHPAHERDLQKWMLERAKTEGWVEGSLTS